MPASYAAALKSTRMAAVAAAVDAGAGTPTLEIGSSGMVVVLAVLNLVDPSFNVSGDVITLNGVPRTGVAIAAGVAAAARIKRGDGAVMISGLTVSDSGADISLPDINLEVGDPVSISSLSIQHSP